MYADSIDTAKGERQEMVEVCMLGRGIIREGFNHISPKTAWEQRPFKIMLIYSNYVQLSYRIFIYQKKSCRIFWPNWNSSFYHAWIAKYLWYPWLSYANPNESKPQSNTINNLVHNRKHIKNAIHTLHQPGVTRIKHNEPQASNRGWTSNSSTLQTPAT